MATFTSFPKRSKISSIKPLSTSSSTAIPSGFNPSIISAVDNGLFSSVSRSKKSYSASNFIFYTSLLDLCATVITIYKARYKCNNTTKRGAGDENVKHDFPTVILGNPT